MPDRLTTPASVRLWRRKPAPEFRSLKWGTLLMWLILAASWVFRPAPNTPNGVYSAFDGYRQIWQVIIAVVALLVLIATLTDRLYVLAYGAAIGVITFYFFGSIAAATFNETGFTIAGLAMGNLASLWTLIVHVIGDEE